MRAHLVGTTNALASLCHASICLVLQAQSHMVCGLNGGSQAFRHITSYVFFPCNLVFFNFLALQLILFFLELVSCSCDP